VVPSVVVAVPLLHSVECDSSELLSAVDSLMKHDELTSEIVLHFEDSLRVVQTELDSALVVHTELDSAAEEEASVDSDGQNDEVVSADEVHNDDSWLASVVGIKVDVCSKDVSG